MHGTTGRIRIFPDISNWNTEKLENINGLFIQCLSLTFIPNISKLNFNNIKYKLRYIYDNCISLINIIEQLGEQNINDTNEDSDSTSSGDFLGIHLDEPYITPLMKTFLNRVNEYYNSKK